ncbi:hypothetical protein L226DRAFT_527415 [Lentinus tigrinus ALCF2SS1-7]|uniref:uncharacterized protein n=1 Tax=Lentinus tigrinus ALCF2SS1-7 TaxID=1328758 RepID=UPI0011663E65|nr:hypothetical protein L226DRAFT_527415 [Lentinus tigrinus ALCF2SS1-7]
MSSSPPSPALLPASERVSWSPLRRSRSPRAACTRDYTHDGHTIDLHHSEHHHVHVNSFNAAEESYAQTPSLKEQIKLHIHGSHVPILGMDICEHTFCLQYHTVYADYLTAIWNLVNFNFNEAEPRLVEAAKSA